MNAVLTELKSRGVDVPEEIRAAFDWNEVEAFWRFLEAQNERGGFFSKADAPRILERHVYECAVTAYYVSRRLKVSRETDIGDAGSGPGLPGYLFACLKEPPKVTLIDSARRRLGLVEEWLAGRTDGNPRRGVVSFAYQRTEELLPNEFDVMIFRALIAFPYVLEILTASTRVGGTVVRALASLQGASPSPDQEKYLNRLGFVPRETERMPELDFLGSRSLQYFTKVHPPMTGYPRPWKRIQSDMK